MCGRFIVEIWGATQRPLGAGATHRVKVRPNGRILHWGGGGGGSDSSCKDANRGSLSGVEDRGGGDPSQKYEMRPEGSLGEGAAHRD